MTVNWKNLFGKKKMCYRRQYTSNKAFLGFLCPIESKDKLLYFVAKCVYYVSWRQSQSEATSSILILATWKRWLDQRHHRTSKINFQLRLQLVKITSGNKPPGNDLYLLRKCQSECYY